MSNKILAVIPARGGSKGIREKNIASLNGKPLLAFSIEHALAADLVTRTIVSTDSELYAEISKEYGAEIPFLRPAKISGDAATDLECFEHALKLLAESEGYRPEICVHLRPTYPIRPEGLIDEAIKLLQNEPKCDSVRTVVKSELTPFKMWFLGKDGFLEPCVKRTKGEPWNWPRQDLPSAYAQNACVDVVWAHVILEQHSMTGRRIRPLLMKENYDIDSLKDLETVRRRSRITLGGKSFAIDIDGVVASWVPQGDYKRATPLTQNIEVINELFKSGSRIILFTARGAASGKDWRAVTEEQLRSWKVNYHELRFDKPPADYFVDDRGVSMEQIRDALATNMSDTRKE